MSIDHLPFAKVPLFHHHTGVTKKIKRLHKGKNEKIQNIQANYFVLWNKSIIIS